jgi:transposase
VKTVSTMPVKTDRNDTRHSVADAAGLVPPGHWKSMAAQEVRALLTARKLVQSKLYDIEKSLRGFGLKVVNIWR